MSGIDAVTGDLHLLTAGLSKAGEAAAAADHAAVQIAQRAAAYGFAGIAKNMGRVHEAIRDIATSIAAAGQTATDVRALVATAADQPSPQRTIATFAPAVEQLNQVHRGVAAAIGRVERAEQLAASVLQGGQPGPMLARLDAIKQTLVVVAQRGTTAKQNVEATIAEAAGTGDQGN